MVGWEKLMGHNLAPRVSLRYSV